MKLKINRYSYIFVSFLIATIGNSSYLTTRGLDEKVTYFGIALLLLGIFWGWRKIAKKVWLLFFIIEFFFSIGIIRQHITMGLKVKLLFTMLFIAVFAILAEHFLNSLYAVKCAAYGVFVGTVITTGLAIIGGESLTSLAVEGGISWGFNGGLQHKNYFACAMLTVFSALYFYTKYIEKTMLDQFLMLISFLLIVVSNSRGTLIMMFVFLVIAHYDILLNFKKNQRGIFLLLITFVCILGIIIIYSYFVSDSGSYMIRMKGLLAYIELYKNDTFHMWYGNAEMAWKNGNYVNNVRAIIGWDGTVELSFLSILVKNGIIGYFGYIVIFIFYIKKGLTVSNWKYKVMILSLSFSLLSSAFVENYITNTHVIYGIFNYCVIDGLIGQYKKLTKSKEK